MGKKKNRNKKHLSDNVRSSKRGSQEPKTNPFEIRINKQKHQVLGKKISKHDRGHPGVSRGKAIKKRKETLLKEYQHRTKSNQYVDKRLGENDPNLSVEDKMMQRFALERQRAHEKSVLYNLNEDEEQLTHYGQSLADIERQETILESDEEEDESGKFTEEDHFGGFLTRKKKTMENEQETQAKSRKELLDDIIVNSKKEKYERQNEKDALVGLTEELDKDWKTVSMLLAKGRQQSKDDGKTRSKPDAYDIAVRELMYDMKASATDRLKTPEEIAKAEKERLDAMEKDRQRRMKGIVDEEDEEKSKKPTHISADDLYDGFDYGSTSDPVMLSYRDGKPNLDLGSSSEKGGIKSNKNANDEDSNSDGEEDMDEDAEESEEEDEEEDDSHSDLESDNPESDSDDNAEKEEEKEKDVDNKTPSKKSKQRKIDTKEMQKAATEELPYTFKAPASYEEFCELIGGQSSTNQLIIFERIRTYHHPRLAEGNKEKLETLFSILLRYFGEIASRNPVDLEFLNQMTRHLHGLSQQSPSHTAQCIQSLIVEKHQKFCKETERRGGKPDFPTLDTLLYLKLISVLFPTSDFRHGVTTPSMLFLGQMLSQCPVRSCRDVAFGLFVCNLFTQYISAAKRFVPELVNFLYGLLFLACDKPHTQTAQSLSEYHLVPPFRPVGKHINLLRLSSDSAVITSNISTSPLNIAETLSLPVKEISQELETDKFRIWAVDLALHLLLELSSIYQQLPSFTDIFKPVLMCLESGRLPLDRYPKQVKILANSLKKDLRASDGSSRQWLQREKSKPKPPRMLEPLIEEDFDPIRKKKSKGNKEQNERKRLVHRHKREMKGAIREIRKDAQFLARHKLKEQLEKDAERKQRVKKIHALLGTQEGEWKAMERNKHKF